VTTLDFLSPDLAASEAVWRSPLERALRDAPEGVEDLSRIGKLEVRGELGQLELDVEHELVQITPDRALILCAYEDCGRVRATLPARLHPVDLTAALAGLRVHGQRAMRRLTDLDLRALPAVGPVARVRTVVLADGGDAYGLFFPQEYGDFMAEAVLDALEGAT
jgi:hypothetical protein